MISLYKKELSVFFSSTIGPFIIGLFLLINGLLLWSNISQFNILESAYASMDAFFTVSPILFLLFISAISMQTFAGEYNTGTIEILITKPISCQQIIISKFLAILTLVIFSIIPTFLYIITIYLLGETTGNLDIGGIVGSYIGIFLMSSLFTSIGVFSSSISNNQISAFILATTISTVFYFGFDTLSEIHTLESINTMLEKIGIAYHYRIISKGLILISNVFYFISMSFLFLQLSQFIILNKKG